MKTTITKTIAALAIIASGLTASANTESVPAWACSLNFKGVSQGIQILIGYSEFKGTGTLRCTSATGEKVSYPLNVKMGASPLAPRISIGYMELYGESLQFALSSGTPEALLGDYLIAQGRAAIIGGVGAITAVRAADENLSLTLSLQLIRGIGLDLGFNSMTLSVAKTK